MAWSNSIFFESKDRVLSGWGGDRESVSATN